MRVSRKVSDKRPGNLPRSKVVYFWRARFKRERFEDHQKRGGPSCCPGVGLALLPPLSF